ncbi:MAG: hypothetical protein BGO40_05570 [Chryseobacterium sp. 39-10]|nr:energy transducer TonB [Chryseobacterium sp.]OJV47279.1 MAG: hypothetical protein BGO40_05570 [Chryseobacterium sp. 39-10]
MKNLLQQQKDHFEELLFEGRNKQYGAYVLRSEYERTATKALFGGIAVFAAIALTPLLINVFRTPVETPPVVGTEHVLKTVDTPDDPIIPVPPAAVVHQKQTENTVKIEIPEPTRNPAKETPAPSQTVISDSKIGHENIIGTPPTTSYVAPVESTPTAPVAPVEPAHSIVDNAPKTTVDVSAEFAGGINAFRTKVVNGFDTSVMDGSGEVVKTTVVFIVEKDGTISDVKASGPNATFNKEAEKTIKSVRGKWVPAKLNGENVRSYFKFPITMQFE